MSDTLVIGGTTYSNVEGFKATDSNNNTVTYIKPSGTKAISANGTVDVTEYASASVSVPNTYSAGDEGKVVSSGALVSQSSTSYNDNGTYDTTLYNSVTVNVSGSSGVTRIASGTFTGSGANDVTFPIGKKMAQTDFLVKIFHPTATQYAYDTDYKFAWFCVAIYHELGYFDLSTDGTKKNIISSLSYTVNNGGTLSNVALGDNVSKMGMVRQTSKQSGAPSYFRVTKNSSGFELYVGNSHSAYKWVSGVSYTYEILYIGSNPSTDIVEIA